MAINSYVQTVFDKAFIDVAEYLIKHKKEHRRFRTMKEFMEELKISDAHYVGIRSGAKGVPKHLIPEITHTLTVKYGVAPTWLTFRKGVMMATPITKEGTLEYSYSDAINEIKLLKSENQNLRDRLKEAHMMIEDQKQLIRTLAKSTGTAASRTRK